jgi:hypothetical protein
MSRCCDDTPALLQPTPKNPPVEWCAGNFTYRFKDGKVTPVPRTPAIPDGVYTNPIIQMIGGCITSIQNGDSQVYSACDPCAVPPTPPTPMSPDIDGNVCNLLTNGADGLLTLLYTAPSSCIAFNGCGTPASPLTASPIISLDAGNALECRPNGLFVSTPGATSGANFVGCGITILNGLVVTLPLPFQPVLNLINTDGTVIITRDPTNPCTVTLSSTADPVVPTAAGLGGMFVVNDVASLTNPALNQNWMAAVGAANPRDVYVYIPATLMWVQLLGVTVNT